MYVFAQLMGGVCGAGIAYGNYYHAIDIYEGGRNVRTVPGTAGLFSTYPVCDYMQRLDHISGSYASMLIVGIYDRPLLFL